MFKGELVVTVIKARDLNKKESSTVVSAQLYYGQKEEKETKQTLSDWEGLSLSFPVHRFVSP